MPTPGSGGCALAVVVMLSAACTAPVDDDANVARGRGLKPARVDVAGEAAIVEAAAGAAFDVGPGLVLRLHPQRLPRTTGVAGGDSVPASLRQALVSGGVVTGSCAPQRDAPRNTPRCAGAETGYLLRATPVLQVGGDTVQVHLYAERFGPERGQRPEALRMEKIYQLVGRGAGWRVIREARAKVE